MKHLSKIGLLVAATILISFGTITADCGGCKKSKSCGTTKSDKTECKTKKQKGSKIAAELGLDDAQTAKVAEIRKSYKAKFKAEREAKKIEMQKIKDEMHNEIKAVLTDEQKTKFEAHIAEHSNKKKNKNKKKNCNK